MHADFLSVDLGNSRCKACLSPTPGATPTAWAADCGPALAHELAAWLETLDSASQMALARQIDVDPRTVRRWALGEKPIPKAVEELLKAWQELGRRFGEGPESRKGVSPSRFRGV